MREIQLSDKRSILVVDDNEQIRSFIKMFIEAHYDDINVFLAGGGHEATQLISEGITNLIAVISDHDMKDGDGAFLLRFIESTNMTQPFILISGHELSDLSQLTKEDKKRINFFLSKPFKAESLNEILESVT